MIYIAGRGIPGFVFLHSENCWFLMPFLMIRIKKYLYSKNQENREVTMLILVV